MNDFISPRYFNRGRSRHQAFSLLEVAFALVIFVIGAIALLRIFPGGLGVLEDSGNRRVAAQMSQNLVASYNSGDLASTTPDAIYEGAIDGTWVDYPSSALGLRRQQGTIPLGPDDLRSAKDALRYIRGERQGVTPVLEGSDRLASFSTNYAAGNRVNVFREGIVNGVSLYAGGVLDFRNAVYSTANRADIDNGTTKVPFREPILKVDSVVSTPASPASYGAYSPRITLTCGPDATTYTITLARDYTSQYPTTDANYPTPSLATAANTTAQWSEGAAPSGFAATITPTANNISVVVTVPASATPRDAASFRINFNPTEGLSRNCEWVVVEIDDSRGGGAAVVTPQASAPLLPVHAPKQMRDADATFYVSTNGGQDQPLVIPVSDAAFPQVPNYVATTVLSPQVKFRQEVASVTPEQDRTQVVLRPAFDPINPTVNSIADVDNYTNRLQYTNYCLDYSVRDWEYVSEDIAQFGTPYPGDTQNNVEPTTAEGQAQQQFLVGAGYSNTNKLPRSELREIRTRLGNLRGPIQIKAYYGQSTAVVSLMFNPRGPAQGVGTLTPEQQRAYTGQINILLKEGRLYLPAIFNGETLSHARVYYRSRDAWAQQVGATPPHYMPYSATGIREPWREYFHNNGATGDRYVYFHAADAGKIVEIVHGANPDNAVVDRMEIRPQVIINNLPAGVPNTFVTAYNDGDPAVNDPREGKTYIARSQDLIPATDTIFDIRRPAGTSGVSVRTLWLNNDRYAQEVAQ